MGAKFINLDINYFILLLYGIAVSLLYCSLNSKKTSIKRTCSVLVVVHAVILAFTMKWVKYGFYIIVDNYLTFIERSPMFSSEISDVLGKESFYATLAAEFIITFVIAGLSIACCYKTNFLLAFILTFPFFEVGAFWGEVPNYFAFFTLLICWVSIFAMQISCWNSIRSKSKAAYKLKPHSNKFFISSKSLIIYSGSVVARSVAVFSCCVLIFVFLIGGFFNERPETVDNLRSTIKRAAEDFSFEKIPDIVNELALDIEFIPTKSVGGTNGGKLGRTGKLSFSGRTALVVTVDRNYWLPGCTYLKGYCAGNYTGNSWDQLPQAVYDDNEYLFGDYEDQLYQDYNVAAVDYACYQNQTGATVVNMDIEIRNASLKFFYEPYYTLHASSDDYKLTEESYLKAKKSKYSLSFYGNFNEICEFRNVNAVIAALPSNSLSSFSSTYYLNPTGDNFYNEYVKFVRSNYGSFEPDIIRKAYNDIVNNYFEAIPLPSDYDCKTDGFINYKDFNLRADYVSNAIRHYFEDNFIYSLSPGKTPGDKDFVQYFLEEQKKGYCSYFASAGVLLMRAFGFPARFAEGYVVLDSDLIFDGDTGVYKGKITDKSAHAWCEVFLPDFGWLPVEFTPGYTEGENPNYDPDSYTETTTTTTFATVTTTTPPPADPVTTTTTAAQSDDPAGVVITSNDERQTSLTSTTDPKNDSDGTFGYTDVFRFLLKITIVIFIILLLIAAWNRLRKIKLNALNNKLSDPNRNKAVIAIYRHYLELLGLIGITTEKNITDIVNADDITEQCYKINILNMSTYFKKLTEIAVEADMSTNKISESSYKFAMEELKRISDVVWSRLDKFSSFYAKYIKFLY